MGIMTATSGAPSKEGITDSVIENDVPERFGLHTEDEIPASTVLRDEIVQPTVLRKVEPEIIC